LKEKVGHIALEQHTCEQIWVN